ncbi:MAG: hypothetical protein HRT86_13235 [Ilumatobacteraceae bacterium]|nr:hypothetical protein [Ilumatobacteraceae bacterium]
MLDETQGRALQPVIDSIRKTSSRWNGRSAVVGGVDHGHCVRTAVGMHRAHDAVVMVDESAVRL